MMKHIILLLAFFGLLSAQETSNKVVYDLTTSNVANFEKKILSGIAANKTYYENNLKELEVSVVIHGGAYKFFVKDLKNTTFKDDKSLSTAYSDLKKRIAAMSDTYEVEFLMCEVGMKKNKLQKEDIVDFVTLVANSTIGLIEKQNQGFAYIPVSD